MPRPDDYAYVRAWGNVMSSHEYYIVEQQKQAAEDDAPLDAIYSLRTVLKPDTKEWSTYRDIHSEDTKNAMKIQLKLLGVNTEGV